MKSAGNLARLSTNVSHDLAFGNKTTPLPTSVARGTSGAISFEAHTQSYCVGGLAGTARLAGSFSITTGVWGMYLDAQASITRAA